MKKICVVTAARSEYGILRWVMEEIRKSPSLTLQIIATGGHLAPEQGMTVDEIEKDGFKVDKRVEMLLSTSTAAGVTKSVGLCAIGMADALAELRPDMLVVVGDRYELIAITGAAVVARVPIAHISGGDITLGAIDDKVRNAVTMLSDLHFPSNEDSARRIERMTGSRKNVFTTGEPGLDNFNRLEPMTRRELAESLGLDPGKDWVLVTLHAETRIPIEENVDMAENLASALNEIADTQFVVTQANADLGGNGINDIFRKAAREEPERFKFFQSLGQKRYSSLLRQVKAMVGNSSSGILEAPMLGVPVINIGDRQKGRHQCGNVTQCARDRVAISRALEKVKKVKTEPDYYYGDGTSAEKIVRHIEAYFKS